MQTMTQPLRILRFSKYDVLRQPVRQLSDPLSHKKAKSSTQVAPLVRPQAVGQKPCALKREGTKIHRIKVFGLQPA